MNNKQWKSSENVIEMLEALLDYKDFNILKRVNNLQVFYIQCCEDHLHLLPQEEFKKALDYAMKFINKEVSLNEISDQNWFTEAAVFGMDYEENSKDNEGIYKEISKKRNLSLEDSRKHAIELGYFIDWTSLYATSFNGQIPYNYSKFLNENLLRKNIIDPFKE